MVKRILILYIFSLLMLASLPAQTRLNPDISLDGDIPDYRHNNVIEYKTNGIMTIESMQIEIYRLV